uniref:SPX domain-containing protein n=1 Tax=Arcella intermedia TaxID=1963864 RepID=A0A6B2L022_9EUKA
MDQISLISNPNERKIKQNTFYKVLDEELAKLNNFCIGKVEQISSALSFIAKKVQVKLDNMAERHFLEQEIDGCAADLCNLDSFVGLCYITLVGIVEQFDAISGTIARVWFQARLDNEQFCNIKFDGLLLVLSDVYFTLTHGNEEKGEWNPPDSFDRQTTKFFVRPEHIVKVKTMIIKHLPTLVFGKNQGIVTNWKTDIDFSISDSASITSVYFDNENFDQYHGRLFREEGATLIRIRWYGKYGKSVFIEQKTHHEGWVDAMSVKERFQLKSKLVKRYLEGSWMFEKVVPKLVDAGMKPEKISKTWGLANEVQNNVMTQNLKPVIRTHYQRTAFQLTTTNHVRISLDTEMRITKEPKDPGPNNWAHLGQFDPKDVLNFPLGVLEIKLHDYPPPWVLDLVKEGYLIRAERFSKFQHGIGYHYGDKVHTLPHWFNNNFVNFKVSEGSVWYSPGGITIGPESTPTVIPKHIKSSLSSFPRHDALVPTHFLNIEIDPINPIKKIEPKVLLASERMIIRWSKLMLLWSSLGIYFVQQHNTAQTIAGYILISISVLLLFYQLYQYTVRRNGILKNVVFEDKLGPNLLVPMMIFGIILTCVFEMTVNETVRLSKRIYVA